MSVGDGALPDGNLIVTGFMGTGKTAVGRILAERLKRPFVDTDEWIEERAGMAISDIFAARGEAAFRRMEGDICRELSQQAGLVIATGGGTLMDPDNRRLLEATGRVICLLATPETIVHRLAGQNDRPLLAGADALEAAQKILQQREPSYRSFEWQIDTSGLTMDQVVSAALGLWYERRLYVHGPAGEYAIHIGEGQLAEVGRHLTDTGRRGKVAVVSNPTVLPLYGDAVLQSLGRAGFDPVACLMPDGEEHKGLETAARLYEDFLDAGLDRSGTVLALGGGVVGDVAGFAAATFMRGLPVVQVPTTLLSMVDSSVGGKTGVDLPRGKNLVGAFHSPTLVTIDPNVLSTLPPRELGCGLAEAVKSAVIADPGLYDILRAGPPFPWAEVVGRALQVKIDVVVEDPYEAGRRAVLNLGHTAGHALERLSGYALPHGEAVAVGLIIAARIAFSMGLCGPELPGDLMETLRALGLPTEWAGPYTPADVLNAMAHDKKRRRGRQRWILPRGIGEIEIVDDVPEQIVLTALEQAHSDETEAEA